MRLLQNDTTMFIFVLLFIGFCIWVGKPDKKQSSNFKAPAVKNTPTTETVRTPNYSTPRSTVGVGSQTTVKQQEVSSSVSTSIKPITHGNPTISSILSRPAVTVVGSSSVVRKAQIDVTAKVKSEHQEIIRILKENGVVYLYHFTDRRNLESIRKHGGLFSWQTCVNKGIHIPYAGGDDNSRFLDRRHGLQDYVRLSLCDDHPMMWRLKQMGYDLVLLKIKVDAAVLRDTLFSDMNATDNQHSHGGSLQDLKKIRFSAAKRRYVRKDDGDFKYHQAEVMVKTFLPAEYIVNLDYPQAA